MILKYGPFTIRNIDITIEYFCNNSAITSPMRSKTTILTGALKVLNVNLICTAFVYLAWHKANFIRKIQLAKAYYKDIWKNFLS